MPQSSPIVAKGSLAGDSLAGTIAGRFDIEHRLGVGGMGEVYRAQDTRLKCPVALKRLSPALRHDATYRRRLVEEAQRAVRMRNEPKVAAVYDVLETGNEIFLVMEFVEGETLRQRLTRPMQLQEFLHVACQCAEALASANERGLIHGDIKPENIMLTPAGQVKILDFGVAKQILHSDDDQTVDSAGMVSGTPAYMAPEILLKKATDGRADIFSLGIVFYETLTGRHPFRADCFSVTSDRIRGEKPTPAHHCNADVSPALESILQRMLAKKPGDRYATAQDLLADLDHLQSGMTPARLLRFLPQQQKRASLRKGFLLGVAAAALLGVAAQLPSVHRLWQHAAGPAVVRLVVLPLRTSSTDPGNRAFCDGLTEALSLRLGQGLGQAGDQYGLEVVPPSEVRSEFVQDVGQARTKFGADRVLEGTVIEAGAQARVIYSMVDATTGRTLGGDTITVGTDDRLMIEDRLVTSVAAFLAASIRAAPVRQQDALVTGIDRHNSISR